MREITIVQNENGEYLKAGGRMLGPFRKVVLDEEFVKYKCFRAFLNDDEYVIMTFDGRQLGERRKVRRREKVESKDYAPDFS